METRSVSRPGEADALTGSSSVDDAVPLVTLGRGAGRSIRIAWRTFKGFGYCDLREWTQGQGGTWLPSKKGVTIKKHELAVVAEALAEAARLAHVDQAAGREQRDVR